MILVGLLSSDSQLLIFPKFWRRKAEVASSESCCPKRRSNTYMIMIPFPNFFLLKLPEKPAVCLLHSFLVAPDIFQANNIFIQHWKCASPSPPMKFVLVNKARFLHTCQTPTTEEDGAEDRGTLGTDPVTGKWDGRGRDASGCASFWPHW